MYTCTQVSANHRKNLHHHFFSPSMQIMWPAEVKLRIKCEQFICIVHGLGTITKVDGLLFQPSCENMLIVLHFIVDLSELSGDKYMYMTGNSWIKKVYTWFKFSRCEIFTACCSSLQMYLFMNIAWFSSPWIYLQGQACLLLGVTRTIHLVSDFCLFSQRMS